MKRIFVLATLLLWACSGTKNSNENLSINDTKIIQMHYDSYDDYWKQIQALEKKGLTKSALKLVEEIYAKAKKEANSPQIVKALLHQSKYVMRVEEDAQQKIINNFQKEIRESQAPTKNILHSYLAQMYWQYYQANRWKFAKRTETETVVDEKDFATWDLKTLYKKVAQEYDLSLQNKPLLQALAVNKWLDIVEAGKNAEKYRPTLYDLLAHQALEFYQNNENAFTRPAYKFTIDNPEFLSDANTFMSLKINTKDTLSQQLKALHLYQEYLRFRSKDNKVDALAQADLERINYVYNNAVFPNKEQKYIAALDRFINRYKASDVAGMAAYHKAMLWRNKADKTPENRDNNKKAVDLCKQTIASYPESQAADYCANLITDIQAPELSIQFEANVPENKPALLLVNYKNIKHLSIDIHPVTREQFIQLQPLDNKQALGFMFQLPVVQHQDFPLTDKGDYLAYSTERIIAPLPNGTYVITAGDGKNFQENYQFFQVTDVAIQQLTNSGKNLNYYVSDRNTGKPVSHTSITIQKYNSHRGHFVDYKHLKSSNDGKFSFKPERYGHNYNIEVKYGKGKTAYFNDYASNYPYRNDFHPYKTGFIFTDRSIYRPGQTVFFKAIALQKFQNASKILSGLDIEVELYDVNHQKVASKKLKTNDFGSVQGSFVLPSSGLTGNYSIRIHAKGIDKQTSIKVEAYKRPKFEVRFDKVKKTFKVNEKVQVTGKAESYAGSRLTGAKVTYRVKRKVQMPRWWYWYRPAYVRSEAQEIAHGTTKTDSKGQFQIDFTALPDVSVSKKELPVFHYEVFAEVTDINGETHTSTTTVNVGYHSLLANMKLPGRINKQKTDTIRISTTNLNGVAIPAQGTIKIYKLQAPDRVLRDRPWKAPELQEISKTEFIRKFPHTPYDKTETDYRNWKKANLVFQTTFDTGKDKKVLLDQMQNWQTGKYVILLEIQDKEAQKITDKAFFNVYAPAENKVPDNKAFTVHLDKDTYHTGQTVQIKLGGSDAQTYARVWVEKNHQIIKEHLVKLSKRMETISVPVNKKDLGGFVIHYSFTAYNAIKKGHLRVSVPYPSHELQIQTTHFRDKLLPGQQEEWSFTIKGKQSKKMTAEVLASMYDASLDAFQPHQWSFDPIQQYMYYSNIKIDDADFRRTINLSFPIIYHRNVPKNGEHYFVPNRLKWFGFRFSSGGYDNIRIRGAKSLNLSAGDPGASASIAIRGPKTILVDSEMEATEMDDVEYAPSSKYKKVSDSVEAPKKLEVSIRKNLQETAFFFPQLHTDKDGNVHFSFTAPDALTRWKLQLLAYDKDLNYGYKKFFAQTQKDLMLFPNAPRFVREGDQLVFSTKISNMTEKAMSGTAYLSLLDVNTQQDITQSLLQASASKSFTLDAKGNTQVSWTIQVPKHLQGIQYKVVAQAGNQSDGEQNMWPVLSNRMLVTETMPMWVRAHQSKTFTLDKLQNHSSTSLTNHQLTLEITSNPAWYAVQSLPYLMEYPHECSEQTFSRFYANALATHIARSQPKIQKVFEQWKNKKSLLSNLEKNQELKSLIIQETPWLRDAQSESEQQKRIGLLFDLNHMSYELSTSIDKLKAMQLGNGGFTWFKGGRYASRFITQHIVAGMGHLHHLQVKTDYRGVDRMMKKAIKYLDTEAEKDYERLLEMAKKSKDEKDYLEKYRPGRSVIHYLYARSFYPDMPFNGKMKEIAVYYRNQAKKVALEYDNYTQAMLALVLQRNRDAQTAQAIIKSLDENSVQSDEMGMYWKNNASGWYWYQAPIETQALLIEAFDEITQNTGKVNEMRIWLLKNKQTNAWKTTKQTTEAIYALLLRGTDWLSLTDQVSVQIGKQKIDPARMPEIQTEAGTGYFKKRWKASEITPEMAKVTITNKGKSIAWGGLYWQYFEDLDKITHAKTPLQITKELFIRKFTDNGEKMQQVMPDTNIQVGDLVRVRIVIKVDRDMEYIHLKDMRASGFEPVDVLSRYKWQDGLGYYQNTLDASTNFFISYLPKGTYVFEYDLRANNAGSFSNGITTIQSMYAPEFSSHSKGQRVQIK